MHLRRLRLGLFVVALIAPIVAGFIIAHSLKQTPTLVQTFRERQYEAALHQQETLLPGLRGQRMVRQQFDRLAESMPPPDHANLGPHISTVAWRTSPWAVTMVLRRHDGALFPVLAYGAGAGVNYQQYAKLVGSRIFPITFTQWQTIRRENPAGLIDQNHSPNSCRDTAREVALRGDRWFPRRADTSSL